MRQVSQWGVVAVAAMWMVALGTTALAVPGVPTVPEVSPVSISSGLALLTGSLLVVRARRGRK